MAFSAWDGPEVRETHEKKIAERLAAIEAHRERHRKRRRRSSAWTPEARTAALAAHRRDNASRVAAAAAAAGLKNTDGAFRDGLLKLDDHDNEGQGRPEEEVDAAFAILALGADHVSAKMASASGRQSDSPHGYATLFLSSALSSFNFLCPLQDGTLWCAREGRQRRGLNLGYG